MKKGDIVTLVTHVGEVIGRVQSDSIDSITLESPRLFVNSDTGAGLAPGICMTGIKDPEEGLFYKASVVAVVPTASELTKAWIQQTSGLVLQ